MNAVELLESHSASSLAAHNAMRAEFKEWLTEPGTNLFDLADRLNKAAAKAMKAIREARR